MSPNEQFLNPTHGNMASPKSIRVPLKNSHPGLITLLNTVGIKQLSSSNRTAESGVERVRG